LPAADFAAAAETAGKALNREPLPRETVSCLLYPKVFADFAGHVVKYNDTSVLPTPVFFYGMQSGEEISFEIERGKTLILKFLTVGEPNSDGHRTVFFELNGHPRDVVVDDLSLESLVSKRAKADPDDDAQVGASMPGMVVNVAVVVGDHIKKGQKLLVLEAMKMETTIYAERDGVAAKVLVAAGSQVEAGDLLLAYD
jgi:pyruvate carboxylase